MMFDFSLIAKIFKNPSHFFSFFHLPLNLLKAESSSTFVKYLSLRLAVLSMLLNPKDSFQNWSNLILNGI